jgi:hypothetical protein
MRKLLAKVGLPVLAAALLPLAATAVAQADPSEGTEVRCTGPVQVAPEITATTCITVWHYNHFADHLFWAEVTVRNTSPSASVTAYPDLLIGSTTYHGAPVTIPPGAEAKGWSNTVQDPPLEAPKTARGGIWSNGWHTYQYSPSCTNGMYCH